MKEIIKTGFILMIITTIAAGMLAIVNSLTASKIEQQKITETRTALSIILPKATNFTEEKALLTELAKDTAYRKVTNIWRAYEGDQFYGYAFEIEESGYGGKITILVGIAKDSAVQGIRIISHKETPGLGSQIEKQWFTDQFKGKSIEYELKVTTAKPVKIYEIQAITGATISSKAVTEAVNTAIRLSRKLLTSQK